MKKVLWIGQVVNPNIIIANKAISAAANNWQLGFIEGLIKNSKEVHVISYIPYQTWPKGPIWVGKKQNKKCDDGITIFFVSYVNIRLIRGLWLGGSILICYLSNLINNKYERLYTYNPLVQHRYAANIIRKLYKTKWVSIVADGYAKAKPDLNIFLSFYYFKKFNNGAKYFLDGGVDIEESPKYDYEEKNRIFLYAGTLTKITGIIDFVKTFKDYNNTDCELHIYGKGKSNIIEEYALQDKRIKIMGFVSDLALSVACSEAFAFICPRANNNLANTTFPSKLLLYLKYEKPIICASSESIAPKYDEILIKYKNLDKESLTFCLDSAINLDQQLLDKKIINFKRNNSWEILIKNLNEYNIN